MRRVLVELSFRFRVNLMLGTFVLALLSISFNDDAAGQTNPDRKAFFGERHIHTSWSVDAWLFGNHLTGPDDALKYAQGATIKHPLGYDIGIEQPLDWMGVTDHSEYVGVTKEANTPGSVLSKMPQAQPLILKEPNNPADVEKVFNYLVSLVSKPPIKAFMSPQVAGSIWKQNVKIADENNKPGTFTAFCSYNFTSQYDFATCTATFTFAIAPRSRNNPIRPSTPGIRKISGSGWTRSARRATNCSPSPTTPTFLTGGCTPSMWTV